MPFFGEWGVYREMRLPEFEAVFERGAGLSALADGLETGAPLYRKDGEELAGLGLTFVTCRSEGLPAISQQGTARYGKNLAACAAAKGSTGEKRHRPRSRRPQQPFRGCEPPGGRRCALPIGGAWRPRRFVASESDRCSRHRSGSRLCDAG
ncbi:hypothetical protein GCM10017624_02010 [Azotobacter vinelandii]|nr:hypothetical protein GCM10017624_02010 [Azotobacter vinelandii]SFX25894.1 hypothetical protein SAMN04244547_00942 [Azotobacter vinelandii]